MAKDPTPLRGPLVLYKDAWALYKSKFWLLSGIMLVPVLLGMLAQLLNLEAWPGPLSLPLIAIGFLVGLLFAISLLWGQASVILALREGENMVGVDEAYRRSGQKFWSYLWVIIINAFLILGAFLLLVIPGIIFMIWFMFSMFVVLLEEEKGMRAALKSREYIRGRWWRVFGRYLLLMIFMGLAYGVWGSFVSFFGDNSDWITIASSLASFIIVPFTATYVYLLYQNLKETKGEVLMAVAEGQKWAYISTSLAGYALTVVLVVAGVFFTALGIILGSIFSAGGFDFNFLINNLR